MLSPERDPIARDIREVAIMMPLVERLQTMRLRAIRRATVLSRVRGGCEGAGIFRMVFLGDASASSSKAQGGCICGGPKRSEAGC